MITLTNSLTGKKQQLVPLQDNHVTLYVCGITPYDYAHIGHARVYVIFDVLYRLLQFLGYRVTYCRNFTDIDDKLIARAQKEYGDGQLYKKVADFFSAAFTANMEQLNCLAPTYQPCVTDHIPDIITFIDELIRSGHAYVAGSDVYFSLATFPAYGKLSKQELEQLRSGARVEPHDNKKDPLDFALWKHEPEGTFFKSPWGWGRPGWHIECSALIKKCLGTQIDIHGGGQDLLFPHHENEIAQSSSLSKKPLASVWMHNAFVRIDKEKMSKSLGNFFTINDIVKNYDPMGLRYYILQHHYRAPLDFSFQDLEASQKGYQKLCTVFQATDCTVQSPEQVRTIPVIQDMLAFLTDDMNTPGMLGVLFEAVPHLKQDAAARCAVKQFLQEVLGLSLEPLREHTVTITPEIQKLIDERIKAREARDWARADELREALRKQGVEVHDSPATRKK